MDYLAQKYPALLLKKIFSDHINNSIPLYKNWNQYLSTVVGILQIQFINPNA